MRSIKFAFLAALFIGTSGCSASWWQAFQADPVSQIQFIVEQARSVESIATMVFDQVQASMAPETRAEAQRKFNKGVVALNHALDAMRAALEASAAAGQDKFDMSKVVAAVSQAAEALLELIDDMRKPGASGAGATTGTAMPSPIGYDELVAQVEALKAKASP